MVVGKPGASEMVEIHMRDGVAHLPITGSWGDTSISIDYIARTWPEWRIADVAHGDRDQVEVWLRRA
jgi:hypothetical protein